MTELVHNSEASVGSPHHHGQAASSDHDPCAVKRVFSLGGIVEPAQVVHELRDAYCHIQDQDKHMKLQDLKLQDQDEHIKIKERDDHIHHLEGDLKDLCAKVKALDMEIHPDRSKEGTEGVASTSVEGVASTTAAGHVDAATASTSGPASAFSAGVAGLKSFLAGIHGGGRGNGNGDGAHDDGTAAAKRTHSNSSSASTWSGSSSFPCSMSQSMTSSDGVASDPPQDSLAARGGVSSSAVFDSVWEEDTEELIKNLSASSSTSVDAKRLSLIRSCIDLEHDSAGGVENRALDFEENKFIHIGNPNTDPLKLSCNPAEFSASKSAIVGDVNVHPRVSPRKQKEQGAENKENVAVWGSLEGDSGNAAAGAGSGLGGSSGHRASQDRAANKGAASASREGAAGSNMWAGGKLESTSGASLTAQIPSPRPLAERAVGGFLKRVSGAWETLTNLDVDPRML
eukprot:g11385.t1